MKRPPYGALRAGAAIVPIKNKHVARKLEADQEQISMLVGQINRLGAEKRDALERLAALQNQPWTVLGRFLRFIRP